MMQSRVRLTKPLARCARAFSAQPSPFDATGDAVDALRNELTKTCDEVVAAGKKLNWVFLGAPGVGKGTYASRVAKQMKIPHVSMGDLVRAEIKGETAIGKEMRALAAAGALVPDETVLEILRLRIEKGKKDGERGFLLDGFPRTVPQAERLNDMVEVTSALNLTLREDILVEKCCGRRECGECGKAFNIAVIRSEKEGEPTIVMPPLNPPEACLGKMTQRADDTEDVVRARLDVYKKATIPVEEYYRNKGLLSEFPIMGGIPETTPMLLKHIIDILRRR
ncbi:Adenylate kinase [Ostreococcus tauri]|uniref:adenylate kinase n=2 Tax=Ostreococcus tauri TaxID=70448 RepID=A0A090MAD9_OSTTA|nr:Adenylate kinase [Ostreococcus tauri]CEF99069.1 Adenylate kinase [Ostreococcus tauri]|eukprot:XP_003081229.2 Adenylate kinase [Ostreococcus tauri]